jgi:hypothetical protein
MGLRPPTLRKSYADPRCARPGQDRGEKARRSGTRARGERSGSLRPSERPRGTAEADQFQWVVMAMASSKTRTRRTVRPTVTHPCCGLMTNGSGLIWTLKRPGYPAVCLNCLAVLVYDDAMRLVSPGPAEVDRASQEDPVLGREIAKMLRMAKLFGGRLAEAPPSRH